MLDEILLHLQRNALTCGAERNDYFFWGMPQRPERLCRHPVNPVHPIGDCRPLRPLHSESCDRKRYRAELYSCLAGNCIQHLLQYLLVIHGKDSRPSIDREQFLPQQLVGLFILLFVRNVNGIHVSAVKLLLDGICECQRDSLSVKDK